MRSDQDVVPAEMLDDLLGRMVDIHQHKIRLGVDRLNAQTPPSPARRRIDTETTMRASRSAKLPDKDRDRRLPNTSSTLVLAP
jgi:hypothetical protein